MHSGDATPGVSVPGRQSEHTVEFSALENFPRGHALQLGAFGTALYRPGTHASQFTDPIKFAENAAGQSLQNEPPETPEN